MTAVRRMADLPDTLRLLDPLMARPAAPTGSSGFSGILAADRAAQGNRTAPRPPPAAAVRPPSACPLGATAHVHWRRSRVATGKSWHVILEPFVSLSHKFSSLLARQVSWAT
jgi:hypothetical protein